MSLSFEFQEQLRAIEESIQANQAENMNLSSEINDLQNEIREGYAPEKKTAPDCGEPWKKRDVYWQCPFDDRNGEVVESYEARSLACVNACAGMTDPASEIQALKQWKQEMMEVESSWNAQEVGRLLEAIKEIYAEADAYADGASDASAHDKLCNEIAAKLKPLHQAMRTPRPTPEMDALAYFWKDQDGIDCEAVHANHARRLEREREENREYAERCKQGCIRLSYAIDRIDYACGEPNEMEVSDYAIHQNEERVVQRVKEKLEALRFLDWTPVTKRLPTIEDANEFEDVEWSDGKDIWQNSYYLPNSNQHKATHWRRITLP